MKLEVGMYVRTDMGLISQIKMFEEHYTKGKRLVGGYTTKEVVENYLLLSGNQCKFIESIDYSIPPCYPSDEELKKIKKHIKKSSFNLIDLIEVGDYVNGWKVYEVQITENDTERTFVSVDECYDNYCGFIYNNEIKEILTKELYKANCYKVAE